MTFADWLVLTCIKDSTPNAGHILVNKCVLWGMSQETFKKMFFLRDDLPGTGHLLCFRGWRPWVDSLCLL